MKKSLNSKIISNNDVKKNLRNINSKLIVLVGGCFDIFHYGHLVFLRKAKEVGDYLIVLLESDEFIKKNKKRSPIHNQNQRAEILSSVTYVDKIIKIPLLNSDKEYEDLIKKIKPSVVAITNGDPMVEKKSKQAKEVGGKLLIVSDVLKGFSTKKITKLLKLEI